MAGAGADEFSGLRGEQFVDGARVLALDRLAGEDHGAAVDRVLAEASVAIAAFDEAAEHRGVDQAVGAKRRQQNRRAPQNFAADHDKAAGKPLRLPRQRDFSEQQMRGRTADIDADGGEGEIVLRPDRARDGGALSRGLAMLVGKIGLVHG